jgi:thioredoxin 2
MVAPELARVARDATGEYLVLKVNTDQLTDVAGRFGIRSIPTLAIVHRGRDIDRLTGVRAAGDILAFARQAIAASGHRAS